ncbi:MAG TPA: type II toxin-antitoxin system HicB family antitoxin [Bryobacteraceae bacterium]
MLHLRLKNSVSDQLTHHAPFPHLHPEFPLKPRIERKSSRPFRIISLPQEDGSFVASVVEAPEIVVYHRSRKAAEDKAARKFLKNPDPHAYTRHPLATTKVVTIDMEYDEDAKAFVTYVKELHRMSSFGKTESAALDNTTEMIRGYIKSMQANRKRIPLATSKLTELKHVVGLR